MPIPEAPKRTKGQVRVIVGKERRKSPEKQTKKVITSNSYRAPKTDCQAAISCRQTDGQTLCASSKADCILAGKKQGPTESKDKSIAPLKAWH